VKQLPAGFAPVALTTEAEIPQRRVELAREVFGRVLRVDIEPIAGSDLQIDLQLRDLPGLNLATGRINGATVSRTSSLIADGNDDVMFVLGGTKGQLLTEQRGRQAVLEQGDIQPLSNAERGSLTHRNSHATAMVVPRGALAMLVPDIDDRISRPLPRNSPGLHLLEGYLAALTTIPAFDTLDVARTAVTHIHDLLACIIGPSRDGEAIVAARGVKAAQLQAIKTHVAQNLADHCLSADTVAAALRLNARYMQRLFEADGTNFSAYVICQRLALAKQLLENLHRGGLTIGAIAYECGFGDISHFNRMFRKQYGLTPSDIRGRWRTGAGQCEGNA
jgi:AraC-like DNA-binding protein